MRIPFGRGYLTDGHDDSPKTIFHRRIRRVLDNPEFAAMKLVLLDCGHAFVVINLTDEAFVDDWVFCTQCVGVSN